LRHAYYGHAKRNYFHYPILVYNIESDFVDNTIVVEEPHDVREKQIISPVIDLTFYYNFTADLIYVLILWG